MYTYQHQACIQMYTHTYVRTYSGIHTPVRTACTYRVYVHFKFETIVLAQVCLLMCARVHVSVCAHVCIHLGVCVCTCMCLSVCVHACVSERERVCVYDRPISRKRANISKFKRRLWPVGLFPANMVNFSHTYNICISTRAQTCITHVRARANTQTCIHVHVYTHTYAQTQAYICIHTHSNPDRGRGRHTCTHAYKRTPSQHLEHMGWLQLPGSLKL